MLTRFKNLLATFLHHCLVLGGLLLGTCDAFAAVEGCDAKVEKAQESKAMARVAYDVAVTEEHIQKPDSVLAMTCFNNLAGIAASGSGGGLGTVFSGDYTSASPSGNPGGLQADIRDALQTFYTAYADAMGADSGLVNYTQTALTNNPACGETQNLWTEVKTGGVEQGVPNATLTDLINGTLPLGANADYTQDWSVSKTTDNNFSTLQADLAAQPLPSMPPFVPTDAFCQNLITAGVPGAACP